MYFNKNKNRQRKVLNFIAVCAFLLSYPAAAWGQTTPTHVGEDTKNNSVKREPWILRQSGGLYTVQVSAFNNETGALEFINSSGWQNTAALFRANSGGKVWYKTIYGTFSKRWQAEHAKEELARLLPGREPWLRRLADVHREIQGIVDTAVVSESSAGQGTADALRRGQSAFNQQNYARALEIWQPLAEQGSAEAQYGLGFMYESGWGVKRDYAKAFAWYEKAAALGHAKSQYNLGLLYLNGFGVGKDTGRGRYWVQSAAAKNDKRALDFIEENPIYSPE